MKTADRQAALLDHKARDFLVRQRTQVVNAIRAHLGEFGIVMAKGVHNVARPLDVARDVPDAARPAVEMLADQLRDLQARIDAVSDRNPSVAEAGPPGPAPRDGAGPWPHRVERLRSHDAGCVGLPQCAGLRSLARAHATGAFQRRQGATWED